MTVGARSILGHLSKIDIGALLYLIRMWILWIGWGVSNHVRLVAEYSLYEAFKPPLVLNQYPSDVALSFGVNWDRR